MQVDPDILKAAKKIKLRYITDSKPGFKRLKNGQGYKYLDSDGRVIGNSNVIKRIDDLTIPPAWKEVWISPLESSHLQATGLDEKGRKQYIYHKDWIKLCQQSKFDQLVDFGQLLPKIRARTRKDMQKEELLKEKVLATIVWLLEHTFIRIGNEEYSKENDHFGLTTLRNKHVDVVGSKIRFEFKGKSGVDHLVKISHPAVAKTIKQCIELPGFELFKCVDDSGHKQKIDSADVNEYLQTISGEDISAKDFRTWGGTVLSATTLKELGDFQDEKQEVQNIKQTVKTVAGHLRNTVSVCRNYYIHPTVIKTYKSHTLIPHFEKAAKTKREIDLALPEFSVLTLLQKYPISA